MLYFKVDTKHTYLIIQPAEMEQHEHYYDYLFGIMTFDEYKSDIYSVSAVVLSQIYLMY